MNTRILLAVLGMGLAAISIAGCGSESNPTAPATLTAASVTQVVHQAGRSQPLGADKDVIVSTRTLDQDGIRTVLQTHDAVRNVQDLACVGLSDQVIWPGNLLTASKLHQLAFAPVAGVARDPLVLAIRLENSGRASDPVMVDNPGAGVVHQSVLDLLAAALDGGATYAPVLRFEHWQVHNDSHANLTVGADLACGTGAGNPAFDWASMSRENKFIVKFQQIYYTVDMDIPGAPSDFFSASNTLDEVRNAIPSGSCPVYVSEVGYGLMALTFIESDDGAPAVGAALDAAYAGRSLADEIRPGVTLESVLRASGMRTVVFGGASAGLAPVENGFDGFKRVLQARIPLGTAKPGAPVAWTFRHLCDNEVAKVSMTSQYTVTRVIPRGPVVRYPS